MAHSRPRSATIALVLLAAATVGLAACAGSKKDDTGPDDDPTVDLIPLAKGATWTYRAKILRFDDETGKETATTVEWKTEVVDVIDGVVTAYVLKGWPSDLADFSGAPVASERVLLRAGDAFLWSRTRDADTVEGAEGWFTEPLMSGQRICPDPQISYCWDVVQEPKEKTWKLSFRTGPDEEVYRLKRGTGVVHYHYAHHGTTNEVTAELVTFTPGAP